jgi:hypothetical protein
MAWLESVSTDLHKLRQRTSVGVFGTTFAGTWAFSELEGKAAFFVDEDPNKIGRSHFGRPILTPAQIPPGSDVYVAFPRKNAEAIVSRLGNAGRVTWHIPRPME